MIKLAKTLFFILLMFMVATHVSYAVAGNFEPITWHYTGGSSNLVHYDKSNTGESLDTGYYLISPVNSIIGTDIYLGTYIATGSNYSNLLASISSLSVDGLYMVWHNNADSYIFVIVINGVASQVPFPIPFIPSNIRITTPYQSQVFNNNPIIFKGTFLNTEAYDTIIFDLEYINLGQSLFIATSSISTESGVYDWSKNMSLPYVGNYSIRAKLYNNQTATSSVWSSTVNFNLSSTTLLFSTSTPILNTQVCNFTDIACHFQNVITFLFNPSSDSVGQFANLGDLVKNKPPMGYFVMLQTNMNNINATGTKIFNIIIPDFIKTNIFDPLKTGLEAILWFVGLVFLYNRVKNIDL